MNKDVDGRVDEDDFQEIESAILKLQGIRSCRLGFDEECQSETVHVLADGSRPAKQIARDIESLCYARFGIRVDHRRISVAQIQGSSETARQPVMDVNEILTRSSPRGFGVVVRLSVDGRLYEGKAEGFKSDFNKEWLSCNASIDALNSYLGGELLAVDEVRRLNVDGIVCLIVSIMFTSRREFFLGTALQQPGGDLGEASVMAVINSVGRRLSKFSV